MFRMSEVALCVGLRVPLDDDHLGVRNGSNVTEHEDAPASRGSGRLHYPKIPRLLLVIPCFEANVSGPCDSNFCYSITMAVSKRLVV